MAHSVGRYPQVEPGARALVDTRVLALPDRATAAAALGLLRKRDALALVAVGDGVVLREDLARAVELDLGEWSAADLARPVPVVLADASEIVVRRHIARGAPIVLVRERDTVLGAVSAAAQPLAGPSLAHRVAGRITGPVGRLLAAATRLAARQGARAFLVGGAVRDLLLNRGADRTDIDIVVEGDAPALARALANDLGGAVVVHERFLTAAVDLPELGVVDVITSRSERYDVRGALPRVMPAGIRQDLRRRDFTVNAMAIELTSGAFELLDPFGGRGDLERRRLRVLHPLSFVEDPTRMFRAARYAARLGFGLDRWSARTQTRALGLGPYPALSGARLAAELTHIVAEGAPATAALSRLGATGAYRLFDSRYRFTRATEVRLGQLSNALAWADAARIDLRPVELVLVGLLGDQPSDVRDAALRRLGWSGQPLARVGKALDGACRALESLGPERPSSARARQLRDRSGLELAWLWLTGNADVRGVLDWFVAEARAVSPALRGDDLLALGVPRGPEITNVLGDLLDARLDGKLTDREAETGYVRQWLQRRLEG